MKAFIDTNILVYAQQSGVKADIARSVIAKGGIISVQILNELTNVLIRKFRRSWSDVEQVIDDVYDSLGEPMPLTLTTHTAALVLAQHHHLSFYDALIVASAQHAGCSTLFSADLQHGRAFGGVTIRNPFHENGR